MNRTKIEWTDWSWNPIKGLCPVNCKLPDGQEYCYARKMYKRFGWRPQRVFNWGELHEPQKLKAQSRIFVCSTMELFHPSISVDWRNYIFHTIEVCSQHTFQILTKFPKNIDREMPPNCWLGVSVDTFKDIERTYALFQHDAKVRFVSFEPLLSQMPRVEISHIYLFDWIIIGRLTGYGKDHDPPRWWIEDIVEEAREKPIFLKNNLKNIWKDKLIQEFPE